VGNVARRRHAFASILSANPLDLSHKSISTTALPATLAIAVVDVARRWEALTVVRGIGAVPRDDAVEGGLAFAALPRLPIRVLHSAFGWDACAGRNWTVPIDNAREAMTARTRRSCHHVRVGNGAVGLSAIIDRR
jgi:hypothetical protein